MVRKKIHDLPTLDPVDGMAEFPVQTEQGTYKVNVQSLSYSLSEGNKVHIDTTAGNVNLNESQVKPSSIFLEGTPTTARIIQVPEVNFIVTFYNTTSQNMTIKRAGREGKVLPPWRAAVVVYDGR